LKINHHSILQPYKNFGPNFEKKKRHNRMQSGLKTRSSRAPATVSTDEVIDFRDEGDQEEVASSVGDQSYTSERSVESTRSIGSALPQGTPLPEGFPDECCFYVFINGEAFEVKHSKYRGRKSFVLVEDEDCEGEQNMLSKYFDISTAVISGLFKKKELTEPQMRKIFVGKPFD
jgi:hypothetical protein